MCSIQNLATKVKKQSDTLESLEVLKVPMKHPGSKILKIPKDDQRCISITTIGKRTLKWDIKIGEPQNPRRKPLDFIGILIFTSAHQSFFGTMQPFS